MLNELLISIVCPIRSTAVMILMFPHRQFTFSIFIFITLLCFSVSAQRVTAADAHPAEPVQQHQPSPLSLTIDEAILMTMENNPALRIERMAPRIQQTYVDQARGDFDPIISGQASFYQADAPAGIAGLSYEPDTTAGELAVGAGVSQQMTTGTIIGIDLETGRDWSDRYSDRYHTRAGVSVVQALLKGRSRDVNLAILHQAQLQTEITIYELRGFAESLLAGIEEMYWEYTLAKHQVAIFEESLSLADTQLKQTEEMIRVGKLAETELVAGRAEMALRRQELIQAESTMETTRLQLLRLLNPPGPDLWDREVKLLSAPTEPEVVLDTVQTYVALALEKRADLNQARLLAKKGEIEVVKTRNGLLPQMDLFVTLGKTGYADSFGGSVGKIVDDGYDALVGLSFSQPLGKRSAQAQHRRASLLLAQTQEALLNLRQLVELDVRSAYIQVGRAKEQIGASKATRLLQEEKLRIETEKFRVGRSTNFMVAQAQRDLVRSRISEIQAVADYLISLTKLHQMEGALLDRRGIQLME